jgi:hypothetical protein
VTTENYERKLLVMWWVLIRVSGRSNLGPCLPYPLIGYFECLSYRHEDLLCYHLVGCHENVTVVHSSLVLSDVCKHSLVLNILIRMM